MAVPELDTVMLTSNSQILVTVHEALPDIIVVSYALDSKIFQGVLLDSTKKFLPCRISSSEDVIKKISTPRTTTELSEEDKLFFSIRQRFTYFEEKPAIHVSSIHNLQKKLTSKTKTQKMTVRLRPRQVLCSKCKSICNENSENVNSSYSVSSKNKKKISEDVCEEEPSKPFSENRRDNHFKSPPKLCPSFVPRVPRLKSPVFTENEVADEEIWFKGEEGGSNDEDDKQMVLRKKRSVGSMEDLWDETVFEEGSKKARTTTPVIKISFGSQGEGTVLKIPSKVRNDNSDDETKAVKKAMKKAKKEARRNKSPAETVNTLVDQGTEEYKKHRHKMKHKKKHKAGHSSEEDVKDHSLKQKISINLKRLTSSTPLAESDEDSEPGEVDESSCNESSRGSNEVPLFPEGLPVPTQHVNSPSEREVTSCSTSDGTTVNVGDIVWGKVHGFPWWPGKVLNIIIRTERNGWDAHVSWFGSSTSSMMPCDQLSPFLQTFKVRYNRRKKSAGYKEAIRQAASEASACNPDLPLPDYIELNITPPTNQEIAAAL